MILKKKTNIFVFLFFMEKHFSIDIAEIKEKVKANADENTLSAITGVSSLFGFARLSDVLNGCSTAFKGRLLIFFPGEYHKNHYRLLDARDGWSYLARPIIG